MGSTIWKVTFRIHNTKHDLKRDVEDYIEASKIMSAISDAAKRLVLDNDEEIIRIHAEFEKKVL